MLRETDEKSKFITKSNIRKQSYQKVKLRQGRTFFQVCWKKERCWIRHQSQTVGLQCCSHAFAWLRFKSNNADCATKSGGVTFLSDGQHVQCKHTGVTLGKSLYHSIVRLVQRHCIKLQRWPANFAGELPTLTRFCASPSSRTQADYLPTRIQKMFRKEEKRFRSLFLDVLVSLSFK